MKVKLYLPQERKMENHAHINNWNIEEASKLLTITTDIHTGLRLEYVFKMNTITTKLSMNTDGSSQGNTLNRYGNAIQYKYRQPIIPLRFGSALSTDLIYLTKKR
jgi:hypothetical protein